jgi:hypothetical protein
MGNNVKQYRREEEFCHFQYKKGQLPKELPIHWFVYSQPTFLNRMMFTPLVVAPKKP